MLHMKKLIILPLILVLFCNTSQAVTVDPGVKYTAGTTSYSVATSMDFDTIKIGSDYVVFSPYNMTCHSPYPTNITFLALNPTHITTTTNSTQHTTIWFNFTNLSANTTYTASINGTYSNSTTTDQNGTLSILLSYPGGNSNIWLSSASILRITSSTGIPNSVSLADTILPILGAALILSAILAIAVMMLKYTKL